MNLRSKTTIKVLVVSPIIVLAFVLLGAALGFYLADIVGFSRAILGATFSTLGFFASLPVMVKLIDRMVSIESRPTA